MWWWGGINLLAVDLTEFRTKAAIASGGRASDPIYSAIEHVLMERRAGGTLLDLGAGMGNLTRRLHATGLFSLVTAADIAPRPGGLPEAIDWLTADLNEPLPSPPGTFDTIVCAEVIEHLENPRALMREISRLLAPGGLAVLSTPNCENIRSLVALAVRGHHWAFGATSYPAHLTALTRLDLRRCCEEAGLTEWRCAYTNSGGLPGRPVISWQRLSLGMLSGLRFSDNVVVSAAKPSN